MLNASVTLEETINALFGMGDYKSSRPDEFHPIFFKNQWSIVENSIHNLILECFNNPTKIKELKHTLIILILKCNNPTKVNPLRPIALFNVSYKIISKILKKEYHVLRGLLTLK